MSVIIYHDGAAVTRDLQVRRGGNVKGCGWDSSDPGAGRMQRLDRGSAGDRRWCGALLTDLVENPPSGTCQKPDLYDARGAMFLCCSAAEGSWGSSRSQAHGSC